MNVYNYHSLQCIEMDAQLLQVNGCEEMLMIFAYYHIPTFVYGGDKAMHKDLETLPTYSYINDVIPSNAHTTYQKEHAKKKTLCIKLDEASNEILFFFKGDKDITRYPSLLTYVDAKEHYDKTSRLISKSAYWIALLCFILLALLPAMYSYLKPFCFILGGLHFLFGVLYLYHRGTKGAFGFLFGIFEGMSL